MEYLKIFEDYSEKLYVKINFDQSDDILSNDRIDMSHHNKKLISNLLDIDYVSYRHMSINSNNIGYDYIEYSRYDEDRSFKDLCIYELKDDYFFVRSTYNGNYKCDTVEGVLELLKDLEII